MKYLISDILKDVRVILDQNGLSEQLVGIADIQTLNLNEIITSNIVDAAVSVLRMAPSYMIGEGKPFEDISVIWRNARGIGSGYFLLPEDYLRLVTFQMSDWSFPINNLISEESPKYKQQFSRFSGVRGCPQKPVGAYANHPAGPMLEFFSCAGGEDVYVKSFRYIPYPEVEKEYCSEDKFVEYIIIPKRCYTAVKYQIAYLTSIKLEMSNSANLGEIAKQYLQ